ncbi:two-component regulator propeller domain-containing protein [Sphingomonas sp. BIUV-7]|uniref:Two-component regulator propeller domain-containing protein n=1 Tax=Sphingomonas natans TaxID=3063330 RepID=A0ABT8Y8R2_9SPHN|nr:ATP-binding protein [Sphingomonas sp. BIUV-7]MDO6414238.1 two-component regulator propeller domain-containing protein [Sphingomonas sp. BIUV-7]
MSKSYLEMHPRVHRLLRLILLLIIIGSPLFDAAWAEGVRGYHRTRWTAAEGAPPNVRAIAQTKDGYLWLGSGLGLYRFDGLSFSHVEPSLFDRWRSQQITALAAAPDGSLWVGYRFGGIARYHHGRLDGVALKNLRGAVFDITVGPKGDIWVAVSSGFGNQIYHFINGKWSVRLTKDGVDPTPLHGAFAAADGSLWAAHFNALFHWIPGKSRPSRVAVEANQTTAFLQQAPGALWFVNNSHLYELTAAGAVARLDMEGADGGAFTGQHALLADDDGRIWIAGEARGLLRWAPGDSASPPVVSDDVHLQALFRDREGNIWGGADTGLERFARSAIAVEAMDGRLTAGLAQRTGSDPAVFAATDKGIYSISAAGRRFFKTEGTVSAICSGPGGLVWATTNAGSVRVANDRAIVTHEPAFSRGLSSLACAIGPDGVIREAVPTVGIFRREADRWVQEKKWSGVAVIVDAGVGRLVAYMPPIGLLALDEHGEHILVPRDKLQAGDIKLIQRTGAFWYFGGEAGLTRYDGRKFSTLSAGTYPWLTQTLGLAVLGRDTWIIGSGGIVRVSSGDLSEAFERPGKAVPITPIGRTEGLLGRSNVLLSSDAKVDAAGQLWFATNQGIARIDSNRVSRNMLPPPVHVTSFEANGRSYPINVASLPAGTTRLQIGFVGLGLTDAAKNRYRYRLSGVDAGWIEGGNRRQAIYTGLAPGRYFFRVIAANSDGVWNTIGQTISFTIVPFFWQTEWFKALLVLIAGSILVALARWQSQAETLAARRRIEDRMQERERIARELHDTLLQGFQGLMLRFQSVLVQLPKGSAARDAMEGALDRADDVLIESRDRVRDLRELSGPVGLQATLEKTLKRVVEPPLRRDLVAKGTPRPVIATIADEIDRVVTEALSNAVRHAHATTITLSLAFERKELLVIVEDDGTGLPTVVKIEGSRDGHYGLIGMRERMDRMGGSLRIEDREGGGTLIRLEIPTRIACVNSPAGKEG